MSKPGSSGREAEREGVADFFYQVSFKIIACFKTLFDKLLTFWDLCGFNMTGFAGVGVGGVAGRLVLIWLLLPCVSTKLHLCRIRASILYYNTRHIEWVLLSLLSYLLTYLLSPFLLGGLWACFCVQPTLMASAICSVWTLFSAQHTYMISHLI